MASPCFADLLDDALARAAVHARRTVAWSAASAASPYTVDPRVWRQQGIRAPLAPSDTPTPATPRCAVHAAMHVQSPPVEPVGSAHPQRELTVEQRVALEQLLALGASLNDAFTAQQLRREYRRLVLHCHPDRHPGASAADLRQLAAQFTQATAAYRRLRPAV